jgi:predicted nucleic acid-binding protein
VYHRSTAHNRRCHGGIRTDALQTNVHAPHLLDVEVLSVLRGLTLSGKLPPDAAHHARADYFALTIARYEVCGLADRVWELRGN